MPWGAAAAAQATEYAIAVRWVNLARSMIEARVDPAKVPTAILDEAMIRLAAYHSDARPGEGGAAPPAVREIEVEQGDQKTIWRYRHPTAQSALTFSGAGELLAPFTRRGAMVTGETDEDRSGVLPIPSNGAPIPVPTDHTNFIGWADTDTPTADELAAGAGSMSTALDIPMRSANGYLWFAVPESVGYPANAQFDGGMVISVLGGFAESVDTVEIDATPHFLAVTNVLQNATILGTGLRQLILGYVMP